MCRGGDVALAYPKHRSVVSRIRIPGLARLWPGGTRRSDGQGGTAAGPAGEESVARDEFHAFASYARRADFELVRYVERYLRTLPRFDLPDDRGKSYPLRLCVDGISFEKPGEPSEDWPIIESYLAKSRRLIVFCSSRAKASTWVDRELEWFAKNVSVEAVWPSAVTEDPGDPEDPNSPVFSQRMRECGLNKNFYNLTFFEPPRPWYQPRLPTPLTRLRRKQFETEIARIAADLYRCKPGLVTEALQRRFWLKVGVSTIGALLVIVVIGALLLQRTAVGLAAKADEEVDALGSLAVARSAVMTWPFSVDARRALRDALGKPVPKLTLGPLDQKVTDVVVDPSKRTVVTLSGNKATVWNLETKERSELQQDDEFTCAAFSADGRTLATANGGRIDLWTQRESKWVRDDPSFSATPSKVQAIAFDGSGTWLATAHGDRKARVWKLEDRSCALVAVHDSVVVDIDLSPDASLMYTATTTGNASVWSLAKGLRLLKLRHGRELQAVRGTGRWLLAAGQGFTYRWDLQFDSDVGSSADQAGDGQCAVVATAAPASERTLRDPSGVRERPIAGTARFVRFSADAERFITALPGESTEDEEEERNPSLEARVWNTEHCRFPERYLQHHDEVEAAAISADGEIAATVSRPGCPPPATSECPPRPGWLQIWDIRSPMRKSLNKDRDTTALSLEDREKVIVVTGDRAGSVRLLADLYTDRPVRVFSNDTETSDVDVSVDGSRIATVAGEQLALWDRPTEVRTVLADLGIEKAMFDFSGKYLVAVGPTQLGVWDVGAPDEPLWKEEKPTVDAAFIAGGEDVIVVRPDRLERRGRRDGELRQTLNDTGSDEILGVRFSSDAQEMLLLRTREIRLLDTRTLQNLGPPISCKSCRGETVVTLSPDGRFVAISEGSAASIWDAAEGRHLSTTGSCESGSQIIEMAFSHADLPGKLMGVGCSTGEPLVFDVATGSLAAVVQSRVSTATRMRFSRDDEFLVYTGVNEGTAIVPRALFAPFHEVRDRADTIVGGAPRDYLGRYGGGGIGLW